uniref:Integrase catalytic domain-containing protein n=1 Tax=Strongyloides papillosus TaxID=174720 RepID=A0A0N5B4H2_STREA
MKRNWKNLSKDQKQYLARCKICIKRNEIPKVKTMEKHVTAERPFQLMNLDLMGHFAVSLHGNKYILGLVDINSKYAIMETLQTAKGEEILKTIERCLFYKYGSPGVIRCDNTAYFRGELFRTIEERYGTKIDFGTAYWHESSAPIKRLFRTVQATIAKLSESVYSNWCHILHRAIFCYNTMYHTSTHTTPYKIIHGYNPI